MHINFPLVLRKMVGIKTPESYFATVAHFTPKTAFFLAGIKRVAIATPARWAINSRV